MERRSPTRLEKVQSPEFINIQDSGDVSLSSGKSSAATAPPGIRILPVAPTTKLPLRVFVQTEQMHFLRVHPAQSWFNIYQT
jgi:hypothetical protein